MEVTTNNYKENSMNLLSLTEREITQLIQSLKTNPNIEEDVKAPTLNWIMEQLKEQQVGGAWKRRLRERGHVI
jgi:hypothetical protein